MRVCRLRTCGSKSSKRLLPLREAHGPPFGDPVAMATNGPTGRHRAPEETRARLIGAAEAEFGERGYAATSIQHICRKAGVSVGSFYHHFDDKTVLVAPLLERAGERFANDLAAVDIGRPHTRESVDQLVVEQEIGVGSYCCGEASYVQTGPATIDPRDADGLNDDAHYTVVITRTWGSYFAVVAADTIDDR